jgi:hypothetical protein
MPFLFSVYITQEHGVFVAIMTPVGPRCALGGRRPSSWSSALLATVVLKSARANHFVPGPFQVNA